MDWILWEVTTFDSAHAVIAVFSSYASSHHETIVFVRAVLVLLARSKLAAKFIRVAIHVGLWAIGRCGTPEEGIRAGALLRALAIVASHITHACGNREKVSFVGAIRNFCAASHAFAGSVGGAKHSHTFGWTVVVRFTQQDGFGLNGTVNAAPAFLADDSSQAQGRRKVISFVTAFRNLGTDANIETSVGQRAAIRVTGAICGVGTASLGSHGMIGHKGESDAQESCMDLHASPNLLLGVK